MKTKLKFLAFLIAVSAAAGAQVVPEATGPGLPVAGKLNYDLRYSESDEFGGSLGGQQRAFLDGDAGYANESKRLPFSMRYGGGYGWTFAGPPEAGSIFQHLSLSQGFVGRSWNLMASDSVGYSFETPTVGFSGVAGSGEPIGVTGSATPTDQTVLALNTRTLDNSTTVMAGDRLDHATTLNIGGSAGQLHYIDNDGQDTDMLMADAGVTRRLDAHNSMGGQYSYSHMSFPGAGSNSSTSTEPVSFMQVNTAQLTYSHKWNRRLMGSVSAGPEWVSSANAAVIPSSTNVAATASISDSFRVGTASLTYNRGVQGGSGYLLGAETDVASANFSRKLGRKANVGATAAYMRTAGLNGNGVIDAKYGGVQASRQLGRDFNVFASYTVMAQSSSSTLSTGAFIGVTNVISFGIGYSPRGIHLKH
jgi:hypothetical protein